MSKKQQSSLASLSKGERLQGQMQGLAERAMRVQKKSDLANKIAAQKWWMIESIPLLILLFMRGSIQVILTFYSPKEICGSNLLMVL